VQDVYEVNNDRCNMARLVAFSYMIELPI